MWKVWVLLAFAAVYGVFIWDYSQLRQDNQDLRDDIATANKRITAQNKILMGIEDIRTNERTLLNEIERTSAEDDAPTAPVLLNAIVRLHPTKSAARAGRL